jgi:hypothetical protein
MSHPRIVTFSRRTDAGLWIDFLVDKIQRGGTFAPNPMTRKPYWVSLAPDDVALLNLWTKAPYRLLPALGKLKDTYDLAFFVTVTGFGGTWIEPKVPRASVAVDAAERIVYAIGNQPCRMWWRYDPILVTAKRFTLAWHVESFGRLCARWRGITDRVIISQPHVDGAYASIRQSLIKAAHANDDRYRGLNYDEFLVLARELASVAKQNQIELRVCCSPAILPIDAVKHGIANGPCLDRTALVALGMPAKTMRVGRSQRSGSVKHGYAPCGCVESVDIGAKQTCDHGCVYCYANRSGRVTTAIPADAPWLSDVPLATERNPAI